MGRDVTTGLVSPFVSLLAALVAASCSSDEGTCKGDADCPSGTICMVDSGECVRVLGPTRTDAIACAAATAFEDCGNQLCVDGYCCDTRCEGLCSACDVPAFEGLCTPSAADDRVDDECGPCGGFCNGTGGCYYPDGQSQAETEVCDGADNDCDGQLDEGFDLDHDGYTTCAGDCDDAAKGVSPDAAESCNGTDDDCDGQTDEVCECTPPNTFTGSGCSQSGACAGSTRPCRADGTYGLCDYPSRPGHQLTETECDLIDNDCDGETDEGCECGNIGGTTIDGCTQDGACAGATRECVAGGTWAACAFSELVDYEATEVSCDGHDNDCDGITDCGGTVCEAGSACGQQLNPCADTFCEGDSGDEQCVQRPLAEPGLVSCDPDGEAGALGLADGICRADMTCGGQVCLPCSVKTDCADGLWCRADATGGRRCTSVGTLPECQILADSDTTCEVTVPSPALRWGPGCTGNAAEACNGAGLCAPVACAVCDALDCTYDDTQDADCGSPCQECAGVDTCGSLPLRTVCGGSGPCADRCDDAGQCVSSESASCGPVDGGACRGICAAGQCEYPDDSTPCSATAECSGTCDGTGACLVAGNACLCASADGICSDGGLCWLQGTCGGCADAVDIADVCGSTGAKLQCCGASSAGVDCCDGDCAAGPICVSYPIP